MHNGHRRDVGAVAVVPAERRIVVVFLLGEQPLVLGVDRRVVHVVLVPGGPRPSADAVPRAEAHVAPGPFDLVWAPGLRLPQQRVPPVDQHPERGLWVLVADQRKARQHQLPVRQPTQDHAVERNLTRLSERGDVAVPLLGADQHFHHRML